VGPRIDLRSSIRKPNSRKPIELLTVPIELTWSTNLYPGQTLVGLIRTECPSFTLVWEGGRVVVPKWKIILAAALGLAGLGSGIAEIDRITIVEELEGAVLELVVGWVARVAVVGAAGVGGEGV
jgi:hypothetical protein